MCTVFRFVLTALLTTAATSHAQDWLRFRGVAGSGVAAGVGDVPIEWSPGEGLAWKTPLPGPGASSPIVVGDRVFVTCYSGYGVAREREGKIEDLVRHLVCVDLVTGEVLWQRDLAASLPEDDYYASGVSSHGYASHTPCSDGTLVYCFFGKGGVFAFDLEGRQLWHAESGKGSDPPRWGSSSSPIVSKELLIVTEAAESRSVIGIDKRTGVERWRYKSPGLDGMWGTPGLVEVDPERTDLVMLVAGELWSLNPEDGSVRWTMPAADSKQAYTSIVSSGRQVFAFAGQGEGGLAIEIPAEKPMSPPQLLWRSRVGATYASPLLFQSRLYVISRGILSVVDAEDGRRLQQVRLKNARVTGNSRFGSLDYASPIISGNRLYYLNAGGQMYVFELGDRVRLLSVNEVTQEKELFWGSPVSTRSKLVFRSSKHLYCVGSGPSQ